jgi:acyl carrier protein
MIETCSEVRSFVVEKLREVAEGKGVSLPDLSDDVDLLDTGLIDSMGFVELIVAVEDRFGRQIDFGNLSAKDFTTLGGFVAAVG